MFHIFHKSAYRISRGQFLTSAKARLKRFKDRGQIIKYAFGIVKVGVPTLLIFNAIFQSPDKRTDLILAGGFLILLLLAWLLNKKLLNRIAKIAFYLFTPFIIFKCDLSLYANLSPAFIGLYNALYVLLLVSVFLTMKLTRRSKGFKSSTLDFLVIFVILLISNLPDVALKGYLLGLVAVKTVILYYSYEVLIGEVRRTSINYAISAAVFILSVKGAIAIL
jgi:UDP-GlcNAc:undecaprenyl-phosphate GlcNAc-1-phosphate transferase